MKAFKPEAKVIADSINPDGDRLTTLEVTLHRYVLAEFNTHRAFSRNSASSRAIPYKKMRDRALNTPAIPLSWPSEKKGMQGGEEVSEVDKVTAELHWLDARDKAVETADRLHKLGIHKSVINRILEPFISHTVIVSATSWEGFWAQRCHPDAQPEIRVAAERMREAYDASKPQALAWGEWHLPYLSEEEKQDFSIQQAQKISAARCARVSYLTHDGVRDPVKDLDLFYKLTDHVPPHASPLEHPAKSVYNNRVGNFTGFMQLRHQLRMF